MANISFIGLGNMGLPMAINLVRAGHPVAGLDMSASAVAKLVAAGGTAADDLAGAAGADVIITMLPSGREVRAVYLGPEGLIARARPGTLFADCSTIDVETARAVALAATEAGHRMVDAPVSGGTAGATAGTLTFMVGGPDEAFQAAQPILEQMGRTIVHAGGPGTGQAAKICNNMILGISMIAVSEAFALGEKLGLQGDKLFDIASRSSGQCWALTSYCPIPGPVPASPANRDYQPGFAAAMMLKDLKLAQDAAHASGATTPLGASAAALYQLFVGQGSGGEDFSGIIRMLRGAAVGS